jgi:hypothetical protein
MAVWIVLANLLLNSIFLSHFVRSGVPAVSVSAACILRYTPFFWQLLFVGQALRSFLDSKRWLAHFCYFDIVRAISSLDLDIMRILLDRFLNLLARSLFGTLSCSGD